ncbi:hypothetical protein GCM10011529_16770 [Polymorphobacter glacialis]|uniref:Right handed beta helix domain-containing protein n=1 Tax=Sandarakinorhabdus glacialis TaxID=1614636 RepID=A0A917E716_9SPHN|nr:right-handed parallel beta-helix repeat-containing protein [Polymorphobacter glacialis]GGE11052.1 hypothetical protein GCM10011529_16770 [Polymorphobacter glacialis]
MTGKTTFVNSAAALVKAAKTARGGDTILLAAGNYGDISLSSLNPLGGGVVTIKSADANNDALFTNLKLTRVQNFTFEDIDVKHVLQAGEREHVSGVVLNLATNVSLVGVDVSGSLNGNRNDDGNGMMVTSSSRISVINSTFEEFNNAAVFARTDDVIFSGNTIRDVREGLNLSQMNGGLFERNLFDGISADTAKGDHSDAIQVHAGGAAGVSNDLVFRSNVIVSGEGSGSQGIYIHSEKGASLGLVHTNIVIENNYIQSNLRNAIAVNFADGVTVSGNSVRDGGLAGIPPGIVIGSVSNASITDNIAPLILTRPDAVLGDNVVWANNVDVWDSTQKRGVAVDSVFAAPLGGDIDFGSLGARDGSAAQLAGAGFRSVEGIGSLGGGGLAYLSAHLPQFEAGFTHMV